MSVTPPLSISASDFAELTSWVTDSSTDIRLAQRARILLLAAAGLSNAEVAKQVGVSAPTVTNWRVRYQEEGLPGLIDRPRKVAGKENGRD
ncbi:helix-turn-helix domain-containing protein [Microbispora sp. H11081]|uniref:helix-turn-helix domain-containing protein n=1 Tax=Microbispora sp. H11081 TaxID=2729107 RepID=UPI00147446B2